jgi:hypothetical protein
MTLLTWEREREREREREKFKIFLHHTVSYIIYVLVNLKFLKISAFWDSPPSGMLDSNSLPADVTYLNLPNHKSAHLLSILLLQQLIYG